LSEIAATHTKDGLSVLAINAWDEDEDQLASFVKENKLKQRVLLEGSETAERYGSGSNVPALLWIDRNGVVVATEWGFGGPDSLHSKTQALLAR